MIYILGKTVRAVEADVVALVELDLVGLAGAGAEQKRTV